MFQAISAVFNKGSNEYRFKNTLIKKLMSQELDEKTVGKEVSEQEKEVLEKFKNGLVTLFEYPAIRDGDISPLLLFIFNNFEDRKLVYEIFRNTKSQENQAYLADKSNLKEILDKTNLFLSGWNYSDVNIFRSTVEPLEIDDARKLIQKFLAIQIQEISHEIKESNGDLKTYFMQKFDNPLYQFSDMEYRFTSSNTMMNLQMNVVRQSAKPSENPSNPNTEEFRLYPENQCSLS